MLRPQLQRYGRIRGKYVVCSPPILSNGQVTDPFKVDIWPISQLYCKRISTSGLPTDKRPLYTPALDSDNMAEYNLLFSAEEYDNAIKLAMMAGWERIVLACRWLLTYLMSLYLLYWFWLIEYGPLTSFPLHGSVPSYSCSKNLDGTLLLNRTIVLSRSRAAFARWWRGW